MQFSKSHKLAILSAFPVTLATARLFEKSNNLTHLCHLEIQHSYKTSKRFGNVLTESTADRMATYGYDPKRYFLTSFTGEAPAGGGTKGAAVSATTTRTVDGEGNILTETDPNTNVTMFTYDDFNRVLIESGPMDSGRTLSYDANGNLLSEITYNSTGNQIRTFTYDGANRRKIVTDAEGNTTSYSYDGNGNVITETRPLGKITSYQYNNLNLVTDKTENGEPDNAQWHYAYDLTGNLTDETWPNNNIIITMYDQLNRPISKTDNIGTISSFTYDENSNIKTETDGKGTTISYQYNGLNQRITASKPLSRSHTYTYTVFGEMLTDTGPNGTINYTVNTLGQRESASGPNGYNEHYGYDLNDNLTSFTDSRGTQTLYSINALNQTTSQTTGTFSKTFGYDTVGNKRTETDYRGIVSTFTYDKENRQTHYSRAGQLQQTTLYSAAGLATTETDANGNARVHQYTSQYYRKQTNLPETQLIKYTSNAFGDVTFQNNPGLNDITRIFDKRRRLTSETNGANEQTQYEYDLNNNRTAVIKPDGTRWEYTYDVANRLTNIKNTVELIETIYAYDNKDNLISIIDAESKETTFDYDNRNRKLAKNYPDLQSVGYTYDNNSNLKTVSLPNGVDISYDYDVLNRKTNENYSGSYGATSVVFTLDGNGNAQSIDETIDGQPLSTSQSFDNLDRLTSRTDVYGNNFAYTYDSNGNRKTFKDHNNDLTNYAYDGLNRLDSLTHAGLGTFDWSYNPAGLTDSIDYPNGASVEYEYDNANRIASLTNKKSGANITSHLYQYDANGNRLQLTESNIHFDQVIDYTYDKADRLTSVQYPNNEKTEYVLDKVGNRTQEIITGAAPNTKTYSYNTRDQLTDITDTLGSNISYTFDNAGNQLTKDTNGTITTFDYTARGRVKAITVGAQAPINYQYDYTGQRINYQTNGIEKRYLYDGLTLIAETNTIGNTIARYHYGDRYQLAEQRNSINSYYHVDSLGTNVAVTNQDGSIAARYEYDAYGNLLTQAGSSETPFGFTGYQKDEDTGLYYANARYYDSETGRFNREDPMVGDMNNTPSLHRYLYGNANPTFYIDLNGKLAEAGHKKTVTIAASEKGYNFSAGDITTLGFFAQVTDEADELDAIELTKNWWFCCEENNRLAKRRLPALHALMDDPQSNIWSPYLNGEGALAEIEVNRTVRAIVSIKDNKKAVGVLLHRLGDLFSHRQINDLSRLYPINLGHGGDGTDPDVIQGARSNLYDEYVQTMISVLALVKGNVSKEDFKVISRNILAKTDRIKNIPTTFDIQSTTFEMFGVEGKTASLTRNKSNSRLQKESNDMANEILLSVNQKRRDEGKRPINLSYKAELQNINHYFGSDITIQDVLDFAYNSVGKNSDTAWQIMFSEDDVNTAVEDAISALEAIPALTVDEAINANKALLFRESKDNKNEFQK